MKPYTVSPFSQTLEEGWSESQNKAKRISEQKRY